MRPVSVEAVAESAIYTRRPSRGNPPKRDSNVKGPGSEDVIDFPRREMEVHPGRCVPDRPQSADGSGTLGKPFDLAIDLREVRARLPLGRFTLRTKLSHHVRPSR
jgi:hypothetical protein